MKNLNNYGVQELDAKENSKVNGGWLWVQGLILDTVVTYYELKNTASNIINNN